ncbi:hypothetical protein HYX14_01250 [Candidatus Woesearchaeota archaeon]|nr:hypothetical protein [Candidatus Woesearchaeota archaeon]
MKKIIISVAMVLLLTQLVLGWEAKRDISGNDITITIDPSGGTGYFLIIETVSGATVDISIPQNCGLANNVLTCDYDLSTTGTIKYKTTGSGSVSGTITGDYPSQTKQISGGTQIPSAASIPENCAKTGDEDGDGKADAKDSDCRGKECASGKIGVWTYYLPADKSLYEAKAQPSRTGCCVATECVRADGTCVAYKNIFQTSVTSPNDVYCDKENILRRCEESTLNQISGDGLLTCMKEGTKFVWKTAVEDCTNAKDDDGDTYVDCLDGDCSDKTCKTNAACKLNPEATKLADLQTCQCNEGYVDDKGVCKTPVSICTTTDAEATTKVETTSTTSICAQRLQEKGVDSSLIKGNLCISVYKGVTILQPTADHTFRYVNSKAGGITGAFKSNCLEILTGETKDLPKVKQCIDSGQNKFWGYDLSYCPLLPPADLKISAPSSVQKDVPFTIDVTLNSRGEKVQQIVIYLTSEQGNIQFQSASREGEVWFSSVTIPSNKATTYNGKSAWFFNTALLADETVFENSATDKKILSVTAVATANDNIIFGKQSTDTRVVKGAGGQLKFTAAPSAVSVTEPPPAFPSCVDSDAQDYDVKGTTVVTDTAGKSTSYSDYCFGEQVHEYICSDNKLSEGTSPCSTGKICKDGACVVKEEAPGLIVAVTTAAQKALLETIRDEVKKDTPKSVKIVAIALALKTYLAAPPVVSGQEFTISVSTDDEKAFLDNIKSALEKPNPLQQVSGLAKVLKGKLQ